MGAFLMLFQKSAVSKRKEQQVMKVLRKNGEIVETVFEDQEGKKSILAYECTCFGTGGKTSVSGYEVCHRLRKRKRGFL